ncbi:MAG: hypothetical protein AB1607_15080 [Chloroflexota bacterium]
MMTPRKLIVVLGAFLVPLISAAGGIQAQASTVTGWAPDARVPGYLDDTYTPFLLADQTGVVHAFASQSVSGVKDKAIVYRQWSLEGGWTRPVDILIAPNGDATLLGVHLDVNGVMHIIFEGPTGIGSGIYYSKADAVVADLAASWTPPLLVGGGSYRLNSTSNSAAITGDEQGNLVIIYSGNKDGPGVYYLTSPDAGENWSEPSAIYLTYDYDLVPNTLRLAMGPNRQVRAAWSVVNTSAIDQVLYFANYSMPDLRWSTPLNLDSRIELPEYWGPSYPALVDNGKDIIILYNGGNPYAGQYVGQGRPVMRSMVSNDGGLSWTGPGNPFPLLNGRSGEHALATDSLRGVHGLFVMRIDTGLSGSNPIGGIWHSRYFDGLWGVPDRIVTSVAPHDVRAVVVQGNVLLVLWREDPGDGMSGIWFSYSILDVPEVAIIPLPLQSASTGISTNADPTLPQSQNPPSASPVNNNEVILSAPSMQKSNPALSIFAGALPAIILLFGLFAAYRLLKR